MSAVNSSSTSSLAMSGLASGINWTTLINDMVSSESKPITTMETHQTTLASDNSAYETIGTDLTNLQNDATTLSASDFFLSATTASSDSSVATATAQSGAPLGTYAFSVAQLAAAAVQNGSTVSAQPIRRPYHHRRRHRLLAVRLHSDSQRY